MLARTDQARSGGTGLCAISFVRAQHRCALSRRATPPTLSFRTQQADFLFRFRSCESVGLRM